MRRILKEGIVFGAIILCNNVNNKEGKIYVQYHFTWFDELFNRC